MHRIRVEKGLTQEDMDDGDHAVPVSTYAKIEQKHSNDMKLSSVFHIAHRLGVEPAVLLIVKDDL